MRNEAWHRALDRIWGIGRGLSVALRKKRRARIERAEIQEAPDWLLDDIGITRGGATKPRQLASPAHGTCRSIGIDDRRPPRGSRN